MILYPSNKLEHESSSARNTHLHLDAYLWVRADIEGLTWSRVQRGCILGVRRKQGSTLTFIGFREQVGVTALQTC